MSGKAKTWGVVGIVLGVFVVLIFASGGHKPLPQAFNHERCGTVTAADDADAEAARSWCDSMPDGVISAVSADGPLLTLWVERSMAEQMLGDPMKTREIISKMGANWKDASTRLSVVVRIKYGDATEVAKFDTKLSGDVVTIGP